MKEKLKVWSKKWWFWVIVIILFFGVIGSFTDDEEKSNSNTSDNTKQEENTNSKKEEKVVFLDGTNSEDYASILSSVTGISDISGLEMGDSITYAKSNEKYGIEMDADKKTKKIDYVQILCYSSDDATNVFMSLNRMNYTTENDAELTNWLTGNIGKKATTKIGDANFELGLTTNNYPYIIMKTDGSDDYMQEQIDKANK